MRVQVLASGSRGNATLVRAGGLTVLVDAGLGPRLLRERLEAAGVGLHAIDHVLLSHGHLDHARSAGKISRAHRATLHAPEAVQRHRSCLRAERVVTLPVGGEFTLEDAGGPQLDVRTVRVPHDCDPTVGFRFERDGRILVHLTDLGEARDEHARLLEDPHVLVLESNHDPALLAAGPYPPDLQRRVGGPQGHLSNEQAARFLARVAGQRLHTVVLAHLSTKNNTPELALTAARAGLAAAGRPDVRVLAASQDTPTELLIV